jgi:ABC-type branched-subunit amino acid transport system ATPase component
MRKITIFRGFEDIPQRFANDLDEHIDIIFNIMKDISRSGIAIIVVEQRTTIALDICDIAYIYNLGKITDTGNKNDLMQKLKF